MNSKQTVSRNAACPCGSGLRYKYCCGASSVAVRPAAATPAYMSLMERALASQQAGDNDTAAELYEAVLATEPDEPDARNMLAVIRIAQGRMVEAFDHSRRAGELTGWSIRMITHNFIYIVRTALANADSDRVASLSLRYRQWLNTAMGASPTDSRISVLLFAGANEQAAVACLSRLEASATPIAEVVLPADLAGATGGRQYSFAVRAVAVPAGDDYQRLNALAEAASGDYLIALRCDAGATPAELAGLAALVPVVDHWTLAVPEGSADPRRSALLAESQTAGFALVSAVNLVDAESALLVPRALHLRIGGYRTAASHPLLDYCLRLLHQAEPLIVHYSAEPDSGSRLAIRIDPGERLAALREYLRGALTEQSPPNQFAPTTGNWGMHFIGHVVTQGLFPGGDLMDRINAEITTYLHWRSCRPIIAEPGVNLVGPARGEFGLAENMRAFVRASLEAGIPCAVRDLNLALSTRQSDHSLAEHFAEEARHNCSIFFLNPDSRQLYDQSLDAVVFQRSTLNFRHVKIGYWFWELEKIPTQWADAISKVDEIWTATQFIAEAIRRVTDKPVIKVPTPIAFDVKGRYSRGHFNLPEKVFLFLFSFDFHSFAERKNPHGLIRAFRRAFPASRRDVGLVIKSINGGKKPGALEALADVAGGDPRILLRDAFLSRDEVFGLQSVVDAYVSLHRAEGLGLGLAESMYQGKPVIGTGYSGNLEFMNQTNSALVDYSLVPIRKGEYVYDDPGFFWAEPDEEHAAHLMRRMVDDQPYRQGLALRGRSDIRERFSNAATAERMLARLKLIGVLSPDAPAVRVGSGSPAATTASSPGRPSEDPVPAEPRLRLSLLTHPFLDLAGPLPTLTAVGSQLCTANQFDESNYAYWCNEIRQPRKYFRKQWEFVYILEAMRQAGMLNYGIRGLGFGCGQEPLAALFAKTGCKVVATDLDLAAAAGHGWVETGQHASQLADLNRDGICPPDKFAERVTFQPEDMNNISGDLRGFDFLWSSCAFEHLGSIEHGLRFVINSLACLRPGGVAVHTTEFNLTSNLTTIQSRDLSIFRRRDFERLATMVSRAGAELQPINFNPGGTPLDLFYDLPPYRHDPHLRLQLGQFVFTSIGLVVRKAK